MKTLKETIEWHPISEAPKCPGNYMVVIRWSDGGTSVIPFAGASRNRNGEIEFSDGTTQYSDIVTEPVVYWAHLPVGPR